MFNLPIRNLPKKLSTTGDLTPINNTIAYYCRKLKHNSLISKTYTINGTVHLISDIIENGKPVKVLQMKLLIYLFPDFEFNVRNNGSDDANDLADTSYHSSYKYMKCCWVWVCFLFGWFFFNSLKTYGVFLL